MRIAPDSLTIEVLAHPGWPRRGVLRVDPRGLVVGLAAAAERGKANEELISLIANLADVARRDVTILRGASARTKTLRIANSHPQTIIERLIASASAKQK
jgi:uncharacterized protein YggU (UPF0235/DUF167 family)